MAGFGVVMSMELVMKQTGKSATDRPTARLSTDVR